MRITDGLRAELEVVAQLNDRSVAEEIRLALDAWVETSKSAPKVLQRAEIERDAQMKQNAIEAIFGSTGVKVPRAKSGSLSLGEREPVPGN